MYENQSCESEIICPLLNTSLPLLLIAVLVLKTKEQVINTISQMRETPTSICQIDGTGYLHFWNKLFC